MRTARIGDLDVSVVGLGCNNFGRGLDQAATTHVVHAALEAGVTFFDAADSYGQGRAEAYLGAALGIRRPEVVIGTKFSNPVPGVPGSGGAHPAYVRRAVERSLRQLGTDYIDLYSLHRPDPSTPIEDTLAELGRLVDAGTVRRVGCSNTSADQLRSALAAATAGDLPRFFSNQVEYSLLHRVPERDGLTDLCAEQGVTLLPFYPLASGMLTGKAQRGRRPAGRLAMDLYQGFLSDANFDIVDRLRLFADRRGLTLLQVAIGWLLAQPWVASVTAGATSPDQVAANATASGWQPTGEDVAELDAITSGDPAVASDPSRT